MQIFKKLAVQAKGLIEKFCSAMLSPRSDFKIADQEQQPSEYQSYFYQGNELIGQGKFSAAIERYNQAIQLKPDFSAAYSNRGVALTHLKNFAEAIESYDLAIQFKQENVDAYSNRGVALQELHKFAAAVESYDAVIKLKPDSSQTHYNKATALQSLGQFSSAVESYDIAIQLNPTFAEAFYNRGNSLEAQSKSEEAIHSYDSAIKIKPDFAEAFNNRGNSLEAQRKTEEAIHSYDCAIKIKPDFADAFWNKSLALLSIGDFEHGWALYEWRLKKEPMCRALRHFSQPLWLGDFSIKGKTILLHTEQGFGDTIQFIRFAKIIAALGASVIVEVQQELFGLLQSVEGVNVWVKCDEKLPVFDCHCPLMSLPFALKTNLRTIPDAVPYVGSDSVKVADWEKRLGAKTKMRVGLVWSGSTEHKNDGNRSIALSTLLASLPDQFDYVSLQKEARETDIDSMKESRKLRHFGEHLKDFAETAALCELMDIVISVDTSVAHLSAALGKKTWILLPYIPDWRWLFDREDSPWYSSVTLYRQTADREWGAVLDRVSTDLAAIASHTA